MATTLSGLQKPGHQWAYIADGSPPAIAETLVAFANSDGGWLVLGIDAEGAAGAFMTDDEAADAVRTAERMCRPPVRTLDWQQLTVPGGAGALLRVERSSELHTLEDGRVLVKTRLRPATRLNGCSAAAPPASSSCSPYLAPPAKTWPRRSSTSIWSVARNAVRARRFCLRTSYSSRSAHLRKIARRPWRGCCSLAKTRNSSCRSVVPCL